MGYKKEIPKYFPPQIRWGRDNEPRALKYYLESQLAIGEEMLFEPAGLSLLPEKAYLGASSDGKLTHKSSNTCIGCLEIQCPYSIDGFLTISLTPDEIADKYGNKFMLQRGENGLLSLRRNHSYYAQVQGEMAILNVD
uniref:YqaJ viral recombinase domain-containing protein n=1 Tax=Amphimedon queenslandica TaxID=400682 RepID=A0A1X7V7U8_AMPQE